MLRLACPRNLLLSLVLLPLYVPTSTPCQTLNGGDEPSDALRQKVSPRMVHFSVRFRTGLMRDFDWDAPVEVQVLWGIEVTIQVKRPQQLSRMREAGRIVAEALEVLKAAVEPGISTAELDKIAERQIRKHGAVPSFKHYRGFPATICVAVNEEVVHGIPGPRTLAEGDVISIDIGARYRGYHGDATITVPVGQIDPEVQRLLTVCDESLAIGIEQAQPGNRLTDISAAIQGHVEGAGFSVVRDLYGHGIGRSLHEEPMLPHYGRAGQGPVLNPGLVLTIEPMIVIGSPETRTLQDGWTVVTVDGSWAAQFEHTVAILAEGPEILTRL